MCYTAESDTKRGKTFEACDLFIKTEVAANEMAYLMVEATDSATAAVPQVDDRKIENSHLAVEYLQQDDN